MMVHRFRAITVAMVVTLLVGTYARFVLDVLVHVIILVLGAAALNAMGVLVVADVVLAALAAVVVPPFAEAMDMYRQDVLLVTAIAQEDVQVGAIKAVLAVLADVMVARGIARVAHLFVVGPVLVPLVKVTVVGDAKQIVADALAVRGVRVVVLELVMVFVELVVLDVLVIVIMAAMLIASLVVLMVVTQLVPLLATQLLRALQQLNLMT